jgi:hypothetical protein
MRKKKGRKILNSLQHLPMHANAVNQMFKRQQDNQKRRKCEKRVVKEKRMGDGDMGMK